MLPGRSEALEDRVLLASDWGDAPDTGAGAGSGNYETLATDNGPSHTIDATQTTLFLGASVDGNDGTLQNVRANADDVDGALPDDEDGVLYPRVDLQGTIGGQPAVTLLVTNTTGSPATLAGWIDYDNDGVFENDTERETALIEGDVTDGRVRLTFPEILPGFTGTTYARFRLSTDADGQNSTGPADDGEVEDYAFTITAPVDRPVTVDGLEKIADGLGGLAGGTLADRDFFGTSVTSLGDVDGDGVNDLAVGANADDTGGSNHGAVYVLLMNADGSVRNSTKIAHELNGGPTLQTGSQLGRSVAGLGDLDGDGVPDLAVGARAAATGDTANGAVFVLLLNTDGSAKSSTLIPAPADEGRFGTDVASLGDLNGDGVTDLAVGASYDSTGGVNRGAVHVLFLNSDGSVGGSTKIAHETGGGPTLTDHDRFGTSLASLGDLDGDGLADLAVGAHEDDTGGPNRGAVHVLMLNADGTVRQSTKIGDRTGGGPELRNSDLFGSSLGVVGDLDSDGLPDLAVGAQSDNTGGESRGALHILLMSADGTARSTTKIAHETNGGPTLANSDFFGSSVAALGDLDADGVVDLAVGAHSDNTGGDHRGAVHLLHLARGSLLDMGDAPSADQSGFAGSYPVTLADDGARHEPAGPTLGANRDRNFGVHSIDASFDDTKTSPNDEDGIRFDLQTLVASLTTANTGTVDVDLRNADDASNRLDAWIDWNRDGDWADADEQIFSNFDLGTSDGLQALNFTIPAGTQTGPTFSRFRLSTAGGLGVTGLATDGEVEDHALILLPATPDLIVDANGSGDHTTIQAAIDAASAGDLIAVAAGTYNESIDLSRMNGGTTGDLAIYGARSVVNGGAAEVFFDDTTFNGDLIIDGLSITNDGGNNNHGIELDGFTGTLSVTNNVFTAVDEVVRVTNASGTVLVSGNAFLGASDFSTIDVGVRVETSDTDVDVIVVDNIFTNIDVNSVTVKGVEVSGNSHVTARIDGNNVTQHNNGNVFSILAEDDSQFDATVVNNTIDGTNGRGVSLAFRDGAALDAVVMNNTFANIGAGNGDDAVFFNTTDNSAATNGTSRILVAQNQMSDVSGSAIAAAFKGTGATHTVVLTDNTIARTGQTAIDLDDAGNNTNTINVDLRNNTVSDPTGDAIQIDEQGGTVSLEQATSSSTDIATVLADNGNTNSPATTLEGAVAADAVDDDLIPADLGDRVWFDANGNGLQDAGEPGLGGVTVTLTGTQNSGSVPVNRSTITAPDGSYRFPALLPGTNHRVVVTTLPSLQFTSQNQGSDDTVDSDFNSTGEVGLLTFTTTNTTLDAGLHVPSTPPLVTINALTTTDDRPELTGTVDDGTATVEVNVAGQTHTATNNGDGTWTLADDALAALEAGVHNVVVTATDAAGNVGTDPTINELGVAALAFDFGSATSPVETGFARVDQTTQFTAGNFGWLDTTGLDSRDRTNVSSDRDRDYIKTNNTSSTFAATLADGEYQVTFTIGSGADPRDNVGVSIEGTQVATVTTASGQFETQTHLVTVTGNRLEVTIEKLGSTSAGINVLIVLPATLEPRLDATEVAQFHRIGDPATIVDDQLALTDPDDATLTGAVVSISGGFVPDVDVLGFTDQNNITGSYDGATGVLTLSGNDTVVNYQAALRSVTFDTTDTVSGSRTVQFAADDGTTGTGFAVRPLIVLASDGANRSFDFNDADSPTADGFTPVAIDSLFSDVTGFGWLDDAVTNGLASRDRGAPNALEQDYHKVGSGSMTFAVTVPDGTYDVSVTIGSNVDPRNGVGVFLEDTQADTVSTSAGQFQTVTHRTTVIGGRLEVKLERQGSTGISINALEIVEVTGAPSVNLADGAVVFEEGGGAILVDDTLTLDDIDSMDLTGATVSIVSGHDAAADTLSFTDDLGITGSFDQPAGILTLSGTTSVANYQTALRSVQFNTTDDDGTRTIEVQVDDGAETGSDTRDVVVKGPFPGTVRFDFGTPTSDVETDYFGVNETSAYDAALGYGWLSTAGLESRNRNAPVPFDERRDYVKIGSGSMTFAVSLPDGEYDVQIVIGSSENIRDNVGVILEGTQVDTVSTAINEFATRTYRVTVDDNRLELELARQGGSAAAINGLTISVHE